MLELHNQFLRAAMALASSWMLYRHMDNAGGGNTTLTESSRAQLRIHAGELAKALDGLEASSSLPALQRLCAALVDHRDLTARCIESPLRQVIDRLPDDFQIRSLLVLTSAEAKAFADAQPYGPEATAKFPSAAFDLAEASKCMALERPTATVFHLMRVAELALRALHMCLGGTGIYEGSDRNWGTIQREIRTLRSGLREARKPWHEANLFDGIYASVDSLKHAWRNPTMHVEAKHTPDEARRIFIAMEGFMQTLSSRMDEKGQPQA